MQEIKEIKLVIHDLIGGNSAFIDQYLALYVELFPEYIRYLPLMRQRAEKPINESANEVWHQWLLQIDGEAAGMVGFLYNKHRNTGVLMDFAIKPEARKIRYKNHQGFSELSLQMAMQQLVLDSQSRGSLSPLFMIAEVEHERLLRKYMEYGYLKFPVEYYEPPYPSELTEVSVETENLDKMGYKQMYLGAFQIPGHSFDPNDSEIVKTALLTMLVDHYGLSADHWLMKKMLLEISK